MASETLDDAALAEAQEAPLSTVLHSHAAWVEEYGAPGLARALDRYATRAEALESDLATARAELARVTEERDGLRESDRHLRIVGDARRYCAAHARAQRDAGNHEAFNAMTLTRMRFTEELRQVGSISLARFIIAGADAAAPPRGDAE